MVWEAILEIPKDRITTPKVRTQLGRLTRRFIRVSNTQFALGISMKGLGSIRGVFGLMSKISFTLSNYRVVIWVKNYRRYFVI